MPPSAKKAEIYIGVVISVAIFLILSQAIVSLVFSAYDLVVFTQSRTTARYLAEEKIETARNISFDELGTVGGIPTGILPQTESVTRNGVIYTVTNRVDNIDDPYDGQGASDTSPVDYKKVQITVSWGGAGTLSRANRINLVTDISDDRDQDTDGGTLDITVSDSQGVPVSLASVTIVSSGITPAVNVTLTTDQDGKLEIPGATPCTSCYQISTTKTGYSTDRTYGTSEVTNPTNPHVSVIENQVSSLDLSIDLLGTLTIHSVNGRDQGFTALGNQQFILRGEKIIGTDSGGTLIYKYANVVSTNSSGELTVNNLEWDAYHIQIPTGVGWDISGANPLLPIILSPGQTQSVTFAAVTGSTHRLLVTFQNGSLTPIASVSAILKENTNQEATSSSGLEGNPDFGQSFFGNLSQKTYTLYATASGYLDYTNTDVVVNDYTQQNVILIEQ